MNHSGDAAEQIVRMSLEGVEVAAKITGSAAKEIALLLMAALKDPKKSGLKSRGRARLTSMLKSGKPLEIFSVKESDIKAFTQGAKEYGIVYCALRNKKIKADGLVDFLVKAEDAPKISRLAERFKFATIDRATIESEIVMAKNENSQMTEISSEHDTPEINDTESLLDDLLGTIEGKSEPEAPEAVRAINDGMASKESQSTKESNADDFFMEGQKSPQSENFLESNSNSGMDFTSRTSVRKELKEIEKSIKDDAEKPPKQPSKEKTDKPINRTTKHQQPQQKKSKIKKGGR